MLCVSPYLVTKAELVVVGQEGEEMTGESRLRWDGMMEGLIAEKIELVPWIEGRGSDHVHWECVEEQTWLEPCVGLRSENNCRWYCGK